MGAGTTVGEMALLEVGKRSASVVCDEDVECYELSRAEVGRATCAPQRPDP